MTTRRRKRTLPVTEADQQAQRAVSAAARLLAQRGAQKGGRARAKKLSPEERSRIAARGGKARWGLSPEDPPATRRRLARTA